MKKLICAAALVLVMAVMLCGCASKSEKLMKSGFEQMEKSNYEEALKYYSDAVIEDSANTEAADIKKILECYIGALGAADILDTKAAKEYMDDIPDSYVNYPIKDDVNALKKQLGSKIVNSENDGIKPTKEPEAQEPESTGNVESGDAGGDEPSRGIGDEDTSWQDDPGALDGDGLESTDPNESRLASIEIAIRSGIYDVAQSSIDQMDTSTMTEAQFQRLNELKERIARERAAQQPVG